MRPPRLALACLGLLAVIVFARMPQVVAQLAEPDPMTLDGTWRFALDPAGNGIEEAWWARTLKGTATLPGTLPGQGIGAPITLDTRWTGQIVDRSFFTSPEYEPHRAPGNIKVPFWLQPETYYAGPAWFQRDVDIPAAWRGRRITLTLERPHWQTLVVLDRRVIGSNDSLSTPHEYDLGTGVDPGRHVLTVRVDNSLLVDIGVNSHSISDHTQGNWNGIVGRIALQAGPPVWIDDLQVFPSVSTKSVRVVGRIGNATGLDGGGIVGLTPAPLFPQGDRGRVVDVPVTWRAGGGSFEATVPLGSGAAAWDEFTPALHTLTARLPGGASKVVTFGVREVATSGTQITVNGQPRFLRGTLECAIFPKTGHPPTDVPSWERIIGVAKAHGLNHLRFHSWCPPEAAFVAADRLGFYLYVEAASWANQSTMLGAGLPVDDWVWRETDRILRAYGNHPSFVHDVVRQRTRRTPREVPGEVDHREPGTRPAAALHGRRGLAADHRESVPRDVGPSHPAVGGGADVPNQRAAAGDAHGLPRVRRCPSRAGREPRDRSVVRVPELRRDVEVHGLPEAEELRDLSRDRLRAHGLEAQARDFLIASGKLQTLCYKEDIESALRTPGMAGFELLDLHDFPGQGTALVGVLDPFWESKGYVTADAYRRFAGATVPLARLDRRVFTGDDTLIADVEVAHFGAAAIERAAARWRLTGADGRDVAGGDFTPVSIPVGRGTSLGTVRVPLRRLGAPAKYSLVVSVPGGENDWDVWVYPPLVGSDDTGVLVTPALDAKALDALASGGRVLLTLPPTSVKNDTRAPVKLGFSSIFWNTAWTGRQGPTTLGILVDPVHPVFAQFPTESHSNWQWWYIVSRAGAMILDGLPTELRPLVQVIDDWFTARKLGLVFEARVNGGRLMVTSIDLEEGSTRNPVARQLRASIVGYMRSRRFDPAVVLTPEQVASLVK